MATAKTTKTITCLVLLLYFIVGGAYAAKKVNDKANNPVKGQKPPTISLSVSSTKVAMNGSTTINWDSKRARTCTASGNWSGHKATSGSQTITALKADSTFILSCSGVEASAKESVSISVETSALPSIILSASPSSLPYNGSTIVSWSSANASSCTASGDWSGTRSISGSESMNALTTSKTFNLSCSGQGGEASDSLSITVAAPLPTLSFSVSPNKVSQNEPVTLEWNSTDVTSCTASGDWSGTRNATGSETINVSTVDSTYSLTCSGAGGEVYDTAKVTVVLNNSGTALLSWTPPIENTDNSLLTDLAGYKIYYGTSPGSYSDSITIENPGLTSYLVENLASAEWYFVMTSFNSNWIESSHSYEVSKSVD